MIARLCLSDLHLGDARSVLSHGTIADDVVLYIKGLAAGPEGGDRPKVGTLVLNGDIWEECVPSGMVKLAPEDIFQPAVLNASIHFFGRLFSALDIGRVVWVPGNHDRSLWQMWCKWTQNHFHEDDFRYQPSAITPYTGVVADMLTEDRWHSLFGYLFDRAKVASFEVSYPAFVAKPYADNFPFILWTHGHLLDPLVRGQEPDVVYLGLRALGCPRPHVPVDARDIDSVRQIAELTDDFTLKLWERYSERDWVYSNKIMRRLDHPHSCPLNQPCPAAGPQTLGVSRVWEGSDPFAASDGQMASVPWFLDVVIADPGLPTPVGNLRPQADSSAFIKPSCICFGHDHLGSQRMISSSGVPFFAADSGGWTSEYDGHRPHSHVLIWRGEGDIIPEIYSLRALLG